MPIYDFMCQACRAEFEVKYCVKDYERGPDVQCPVCRSSRVKRVLASVQVAGHAVSGGHAHEGHSCGCGSGCCHN